MTRTKRFAIWPKQSRLPKVFLIGPAWQEGGPECLTIIRKQIDLWKRPNQLATVSLNGYGLPTVGYRNLVIPIKRVVVCPKQNQ